MDAARPSRCSTTPTSPAARKLIDTQARAGLRAPATRRKGGTIYLTRRRRARHDGELHPEQLHGLRLGRASCRATASRLQNRGHGFILDAGSPNVRRARASGRSTPSSRPSSRKDGQPLMSFGVMGGNMQPQGHMQTLVRMLDYGQQPQAACDAPRWRFNAGLEINVEAAMDAGDGAGPGRRAATRSRSSTTATRTSAPASSSGASAIRRSKATSPPAIRAATGRPPAGRERLPVIAAQAGIQRHGSRLSPG